MKYFAERHNLLNNELKIDFEDLKKYFYQTYLYFYKRGYFEAAFNGISVVNWGKEEQIMSPTMAPSPQIYFINNLQRDDVLPIWEKYQNYSEEVLFTVIEILYDHIGVFDYKSEVLEKDKAQQEFSEHINNLLKMYQSGYYLETKNGFIMELPNDAVQALFQAKLPEHMSDDVIGKIKTAFKMFYRFDADIESKRKAVNILADVLEPLRGELRTLLNQNYEINKNEHDKLIFEIVNNFNIRHNNKNQLTDYNKDIWYDWMMQYYSSVILTYYRLKNSVC